MIRFHVNVFAGSFPDRESALRYAEWNYERNPDDPHSDFSEEFGGIRYDGDFVETIWGAGRIDYLKTIIDESDVDQIVKLQRPEDNTLILLMEIERNRDIKIPQSVSARLIYCGRFQGTF
jgi:hypothetical protein